MCSQSASDGAVPVGTCCFGPDAQSGQLWEPLGTTHMKGPAGVTSTKKVEEDEASMAMLWKQSEAATGAVWAL